MEPYEGVVEKLIKEGVETAAICERLKERGYEGSYWSVYRFVRGKKGGVKQVTVRVEREPGEEAQVEFGYAGKMIEPETGKQRRAWAFVMTLSWSRHQYVEFVFDQKVETWLCCHRNAFNFFGGVPQRVVIDNLKAAIVKALADDPEVQTSYRECALHYGFLIGPCRVRTPEHKGKVEQGGVHYVKRNFLGGRDVGSIHQANREVLDWCRTTAGQRRHGTTKEPPWQRFEEVEQGRLQALPATAYDVAIWKQLKLGRDCYIEFEGSYYSAPYRLVGQKLRVCGGIQQVRIFDQAYRLQATHERAKQAGTRSTHRDHLPPEKVRGLYLSREECLQEAKQIGTATQQVVEYLLSDPVLDRLPTVGRLLKLRQSYGVERLEAGCARALVFDDPSYKTVKGILKKGLEQTSSLPAAYSGEARIFVRPLSELLGTFLGGIGWN